MSAHACSEDQQQEQERCAAQLDAYAAALGGTSRGLYFPLHVGWREDVP